MLALKCRPKLTGELNKKSDWLNDMDQPNLIGEWYGPTKSDWLNDMDQPNLIGWMIWTNQIWLVEWYGPTKSDWLNDMNIHLGTFWLYICYHKKFFNPFATGDIVLYINFSIVHNNTLVAKGAK